MMTMRKDLVCGMEINEAMTEFKATYAGTTYYFCSPECLGTFRRLAKVFSKDAVDSMSPTRLM